VKAAVILSTCNRMEVYALVEDSELSAAFTILRTHLSQFHSVPEAILLPISIRKPNRMQPPICCVSPPV